MSKKVINQIFVSELRFGWKIAKILLILSAFHPLSLLAHYMIFKLESWYFA